MTPNICFVEIIAPDFIRTSQVDPTLYHLRINFVASCLDENDNLVAYEVDTEGAPTIYSFTGSIELAGDDTSTTKNEKIAAAALVGFGSIDVPVVFI